MADILQYPGSISTDGVTPPFLQNTIYPANKGFDGKVSLGMGRMTRRFSDIAVASGEGASEAQLQALYTALTQAQSNASTPNLTVNLQGLRGLPGIPGINGVAYDTPRVGGNPGFPGADGEDGEDGVDAFDNIDIPIPYDGWKDAFTDDDPGAGSVSWTSFKVKFQSTAYTVALGNTANPYLYWDSSSPTVVSSTSTKSVITGFGKYLIGWNDGGTFKPSQFIPMGTVGFLDVSALSALAADLGTVTAGTLTGGIVRTAASGARVELDGASATKQIAAYNASAQQTFQVKSDGSGFWGLINGGVYPIAVSAAGAVTIRGDKLTITGLDTPSLVDAAVETAKVDDSATKIWNSSVGGNAAHTTGGSPIEVAGSWYHQAGGGTASNVTVQLKYDGTLISEDTKDIPAGTFKTFDLFGIASSSSGSVTMNATVNSGSGYSQGLSYTRAMEDKGK